MRYEGDINKAQQVEINMPRGSGSVDKAPDSQWICAGSKAQRFLLLQMNICIHVYTVTQIDI